jgi:DNA-binding XRE family transcriptional regulator
LKTGASNKEIAQVLGICDGTVKVHLHSIYEKLEVAGRCKLIAKATKVLLRKQAGRWLRELRENCGLSQRQLAAKVGAKYYTSISQLEAGRGRIPPDRYLVWAAALDVEPQEFVRTLMCYYDPET